MLHKTRRLSLVPTAFVQFLGELCRVGYGGFLVLRDLAGGHLDLLVGCWSWAR